jgi:hypothetical protein
MDGFLEQCLPPLIKKAADTNQFIAEEAEKAIINACIHCSEQKICNAIGVLGQAKASSIKQKVLLCYCTVMIASYSLVS